MKNNNNEATKRRTTISGRIQRVLWNAARGYANAFALYMQMWGEADVNQRNMGAPKEDPSRKTRIRSKSKSNAKKKGGKRT